MDEKRKVGKMDVANIEAVFLAAKKVLDQCDWDHGEQDQVLGELEDASIVGDQKRQKMR